MANKFYYNGILLRTSKTRVYTHAVINTNCGNDRRFLLGCSSTFEGAQKLLNQKFNWYISNIDDCKREIKALQQGKKSYWCKYGNRSFLEPITKTVEELEQYIKEYEADLEFCRNYLKVVELEMK